MAYPSNLFSFANLSSICVRNLTEAKKCSSTSSVAWQEAHHETGDKSYLQHSAPQALAGFANACSPGPDSMALCADCWLWARRVTQNLVLGVANRHCSPSSESAAPYAASLWGPAAVGACGRILFTRRPANCQGRRARPRMSRHLGGLAAARWTCPRPGWPEGASPTCPAMPSYAQRCPAMPSWFDSCFFPLSG